MLCREDGGVLDDLFTYRLAADRWLTVTNAANHDKDLAWLRATPTASTPRCTTPPTATRCSPSRARGARGRVQALSDGAAARALHASPSAASPGATALVCGTGYTGEDGVELLLDGADAPAVWDELLAAGPRPSGWPRATRCGSRRASISTATT